MAMYSAPEQIRTFFEQLVVDDACIISDMDGTFGVGFDVYHKNNLQQPLPVRINDLGITAGQLFDASLRNPDGYLVGDYLISPARYFASSECPMNVYIPPKLVAAINCVVLAGYAEKFIINTGRGYDELEQILRQSGVSEPAIKRMYSVTSHGTELRLGKDTVFQLIQPLTELDHFFLQELFEQMNDSDSQLAMKLKNAVADALFALGVPEDEAWQLSLSINFKKKEKGTEVGYRTIVDNLVSAGYSDTSADAAVSGALDCVLSDQVSLYEHTQLAPNRVRLGVCEENKALEIRQLGVNKALGMKGLFAKMLELNYFLSGQRVIFGADSMLKVAGDVATERTDYSAACAMMLPSFSALEGKYVVGTLAEGTDHLSTAQEFGLRGGVIYIQHPEGSTDLPDNADGLIPDAKFDFPSDHPLHPANGETGVNLVMHSPAVYADMMAEMLLRQLVQ